MIEDANKSTATKEVTASVLAHLDVRGCKPVETEVPIFAGWVADVAGLLDPTQTELIALKLVTRTPRWNDPRRSEWQKSVERVRRFMTVCVEVKVSRSDFTSDTKWERPCPADLLYLATPKGLVSPEELPVHIGLLWLCGSTLRVQRAPSPQQIGIEQQLRVACAIALRRDHATRYERLREWNRSITERRAIDRVDRTVRNTIAATRAIFEGKHGDAKSALSYYGVRKCPPLVEEGLQNEFGKWKRESSI